MLRIERVSYELKGRKLVKDISLQIRKGEVVALLGSNGAGKSTLMRLISGEISCSEGTIFLNDLDISKSDKRELAKSRAMLSQQQSINMAFTAKELVIMGRYPHFSSSASVRDWKIVDEAMEICGVMDFSDRSYLTLSGGEQQRVQLARVLSQVWDNPNALLLLDEPISALDLHYQQKVLAIAKALSRRGMMVVVVLHDINMASLYADRIVMLKNARKWLDGTPMEVLNTKDIYTVFSVESAVNMDISTLKPQVAFKEMEFGSEEFNSLLPVLTEGKEKLTVQIQEIQRTQPHIKYYTLAKMLHCSELEVLQANKSNQITYLSNAFSEVIRILSQAKETVLITHQDNFELQTSHSGHQLTLNNEQFEIYDNQEPILKACSQKIGVFVLQNMIDTSVFFYEEGNILFQLKIDEETYTSLKSDLRIPSPSLFKNRKKDTRNNKENASIGTAISTDILKKIIAFLSKNQIKIQIQHHTLCCIHSFRTRIENIIDQGEYYMLRSMDLRCTWRPNPADVIRLNENKNELILDMQADEKAFFHIAIPISTAIVSFLEEIKSTDKTSYLEQL